MTRQGPEPSVAIAHDYLTQRGGAERVVLAMARAFPGASIYTTLYEPDLTFPEFREFDIRTSRLNAVSLLRKHHRVALPLLPWASSSMHIDADIVICSSSGWAHGFSTNGQRIVYCYSPARWLYQADDYLGESNRLKAVALALLKRPLKRWDMRRARSAEMYLAISSVIQQRIRRVYGRESEVVPAPVTLARAATLPESVAPVARLSPGEFVLCVSRLLPYKNVEQVMRAIEAKPDLTLVVVGRGPDQERLRAIAPTNVVMLSDLTDGNMRWLYEHCRGLIAASYEDFGLTPLEAAAAGKPSAVLRAGGYLDTMSHDTAVFFDEPTPAAIGAAVDQMLASRWDEARITKRLERFSEAEFAHQLQLRVAALAATRGLLD